jgi:hypothetical protein
MSSGKYFMHIQDESILNDSKELYRNEGGIGKTVINKRMNVFISIHILT